MEADLKVAIVHYWLVQMRGGEKVVQSLLKLFPEADIYTHVFDANAVHMPLHGGEIKTSFISKLPGARRHYQAYLPLMPMALEQLDLSHYDLVISSESGPAKGIIVRPDALHICYCHSPMRYIWDLKEVYSLKKGWQRTIAAPLLHYMRMWDVNSAARVDHFIANSSFVAKRIEKYYRRDADVIFPPIDTDRIACSPEYEDFYLVAGQLTEYKKARLVIEAFNKNGRQLVVIGGGEQLQQLRAIAGPNVSVLGNQPDEVLLSHMRRCKALIFPGIEDFGMVPVEAMAAGKPVLAYAAGGVLDTVIDGVTGMFFFEQTSEAIDDVVNRFEDAIDQFDPRAISNHAQTFSESRFLKDFLRLLTQKLNSRETSLTSSLNVRTLQTIRERQLAHTGA